LDNFRVKLIKPGASKFKMMTKKIILLSLVIASCFHSQGQEKPLTKGLKISKSVKIKKQTYKLDAPSSLDGALIVIEGNDITVDFNNAMLKGSNLKKNPDEFFGVAILII
jgi:hypothetical protein